MKLHLWLRRTKVPLSFTSGSDEIAAHPSTLIGQLPNIKRSTFVGFILALLCSFPLTGQSVRLSLPEVTVADGETVTLPLTVTDFDSIASLQLSINWDTEVATYVDFELDALPLLAIGDFQADQGELRLSWFDNGGDGESLPDGTVIARLTFTAMGDPGDFTTLPFTGDPLAIQIFKSTMSPGVFEPVALEQDPGRIAIASPLGFSINSSDVSCFGLADGNATVSLAVDPADYSFLWTGPDNFSATSLNLTNLNGGTYLLTITDQDGTDVFSYELIIEEATAPLSIENLEVTEADCDAPNGSLNVLATGGTSPFTYQLNGISNSSGSFMGLAAGNYSLIIEDANDCTISLDTMVTAPGAPVLGLPSSVMLCGESTALVPGGVGDYNWSTGETTDSIVVTMPGSYAVTVTNIAGCSAEATIEVLPGMIPIGVLETDFPEICPGDSLQLNVSGGSNYRWLADTSSLSAMDIFNPLAFPDTTTNYQVEVGNDCGLDTLAFSLLVYDVLATAGADTCIAPGDEARLMAQGGIFYTWEDNPFPVSDPSVPNPTVSPEDSTTYRVAITDINGCETLDEVTVLVANNPVESIVPYNLITPNGDGLNDELDFGPITKFGSNSLKVYNRWGDLVYQKLNYQSDEDRFVGLYKDARLPAGNYFYVLAFRQGEIKQTLTIVWE
ncbi:gliding motility-associated C-terminal domain-containing protein [Lewinella cohaerens]|uniref:T9SS type B sorting domain-containing protein n=1 Tax=Lewinella cohaerens TaxID=70995 RepID=UPI0003825D1D|nr:gliding motility-associated C-terminal domain-containing protein [Lewinella cohaerens]